LLRKDEIFNSLTNQVRVGNTLENTNYSKSREFTDEHKRKLSKAKKGKNNPNINGLSKKHKQKIRESKIGSKNPSSKLDASEAAEIKFLSRNTEITYKDLGNRYGVSKYTISDIKNDHSWDHISPSRPK